MRSSIMVPRHEVSLLASLFASLFVAAGCGGAAPAAPVAPPSNTTAEQVAPETGIAGKYVASHVVMVVCDGGDDGWCEEPVDDTMTVVDVPDGSVDVVIELVRTNAHTCSFEGRLASSDGGGRRWVHRSDDPDEGSCTLTLEQTETELRLDAEGCRYYCGARATLDATFPYPPPRG